MMIKRKQYIIILLLCVVTMFGSNMAWASDEIPSSGTYTLNSNITLTHKLTLTGNLTINTNGNYTISKGTTFNDDMIYAGDYNLTINGTSTQKITFDAGGGWNGDASNLSNDPSTITNHKGKGSIIKFRNGALNMTWVVMQNVFKGSALWMNGNASGHVACNLTDVEIKGCYGWNTGVQDYSEDCGTGIYFVGGDYHIANLTRVKIHHCKACFGIIRTNGGTGTVLTMTNCEVYNNTVAAGGVMYWNGAAYADTKVTIKGSDSKFHHNTASANGGAFFIETRLDFQAGAIYNNSANNGGGIYLTAYSGSSESFDGTGFNLTVGANVEIHDNTATTAGGGVYLTIYDSKDEGYDTSGNPVVALFKFTIAGGKVYNNSANMGGGLYVNDNAPRYGKHEHKYVYHTGSSNTLITSGEYKREFYITSGSLYGNYTTGTNAKGAGICINKYAAGSYTDFGTSKLEISGGSIYQNKNEHGDGGAIYILNNFNMSTQTSQCNVVVTNTNSPEIFGNSCSGNGAGIYLDRGSFTMTGGIIGKSGTTQVPGSNPAVYKTNENVAEVGGGGFYITGDKSTISISGGTIQYNKAAQGGGFYANGGSGSTTTVTGGNIQYNHATAEGGGAYANAGTMTVNYSSESAGKIHYNYSDSKGGGLYISETGTLNLVGKTTLENNRVPFACFGGGVYLEGKMQAGQGSTDVIKVTNNYADVDGATITDFNRNNIYLHNPAVNSAHKGVITVVNDGLDLGNSSVGFSVSSNYVPVIYCSTRSYLPTVKASNAIFEDSYSYEKYYGSPYDLDYVYLAADTWVLHQTTAPASGFSVSGNNVTISSKEGLAWLISYVNNLNGVTGDHTGVIVTLTSDINMEAHKWVPIGNADKNFSGTFNGNGHVIKGINCSYIKGDGGTGTDIGMFGVTDGATIHDVFLSGAHLLVRDHHESDPYGMGVIVNEAKGNTSIYNCIADAKMESMAPTTIMGGLVGKLTNGTIHSSAAMAEMTGYTMGGLVGQVTSGGNLYNSFANPKFTVSGGTPNVGGLVAENSGQIENCYVRLGRAQSLGSAHFGMLAATNSGTNNIVKCYAPDGAASQFSHSYTYLYNNATTGLAHCDLYKKVDAPYLYTRPNDNLVGSTGSTMTDLLNSWVDDHSGYAKWKRSTAGGYSYTYDDGRADITVTGGNINDDYPLPKMQGLCCAASPDGICVEYKKSLKDMVTKYNDITGGGTIWLYASPKNTDGTDESVNVNNDSDVLLYIDEDATLLQSAGNSLTAYISQTLKTYAAERWHDFSSSLKESKIGISYTDNGKVDFSWASDPCGVKFSADNDNALFPSDIAVASMDLYSFYEPEYHWINFRRNSLSHWHENAHDVQINYNGNGINTSVVPYTSYSNDGNEPILVPGKGYLVSVDKEQLLQNKGVLNNGNVTLCNVTKTDFNAWAERLGFNLLGNPYQSYLDFEKFINDNGSNLWASTSEDSEYNNTFAVFDPELNAYRQYKKNTSYDSYGTSQYIHPHQGFFIRMTNGNASANSTTVTYTNNMRVGELPTGATSPFRSDEIGVAFPLINFLVRDSESNGDVAVLELGRTNEEGALKMRLGECTGRISLGYEGDDYGILFRNEVEDYQSLRFEATEAGTFTLTWNTANAEFDKLTLIDNIAGTTTDMLGRESYCFEATPDQYPSRFKVVIGDYKGIEEPEEDGLSTGSRTFAFQMGDQLVVNGEGDLQIVDMLGRIVMTDQLTGSQSTTSLPKTAGVYLLRLTGSNGTQTQKIVIR